MPQCDGQLNLVCDSCEGTRFIPSTDTPNEVCTDCGGTGIDPDAAFVAVVVVGMWQKLPSILDRLADDARAELDRVDEAAAEAE